MSITLHVALVSTWRRIEGRCLERPKTAVLKVEKKTSGWVDSGKKTSTLKDEQVKNKYVNEWNANKWTYIVCVCASDYVVYVEDEQLAVFGILNICEHTKGPMGLVRVNVSLSQVLSLEGLHAASICVFDILNLHHLSAQDVSLRGLLTCASTCEFTCAPLISHHFVDLISLQNTFFTNSWILTSHIFKSAK